MHSQIGIAVIGSGYWGHNLIRNSWEAEECRFVCVWDTDSVVLSKALRCYPTIEVTQDYVTVLANVGVDAVVIELVLERLVIFEPALLELVGRHAAEVELQALADHDRLRIAHLVELAQIGGLHLEPVGEVAERLVGLHGHAVAVHGVVRGPIELDKKARCADLSSAKHDERKTRPPGQG